MQVALNIGIVVATFFFMEGVAWFTHKYIMHGVLWSWHKSHHTVHPHKLERNSRLFTAKGCIHWHIANASLNI